MSNELQPLLPPELEEIIFSLCLSDDWGEAQTLLLVAKRVYQWLIPQLYKVAIFHYERFIGQPPRYSSQSLVPHGQHVRHMLIYDGASVIKTGLYNDPDDCIALCHNLTQLALWITDPTNDAKQSIVDRLSFLHHLTHLSLDFEDFSDVITGKSQERPITIFPTVTHLELVSISETFKPEMIEESFPALTNITLEGLNSSKIAPITTAFLLHEPFNRRLESIVWFLGTSGSHGRFPEVVSTTNFAPEIHDPRVVVLRYGQKYVETWYIGATGGMGIWKTAEEEVKRRR